MLDRVRLNESAVGNPTPKRRINLMVDSGAFSAWQSGTEVDLNAYIKWLQKYEKYLHSYVVLDVMPTEGKGTESNISCARASYRNLQVMLDRGLRPMPVFHQGEPFHFLARMIRDGHTYIGIGGSASLAIAKRRDWLNEVFTLLCDRDGRPCIKTHGLGMGAPELIGYYPFYTVDSTSWIIGGAAYGRIVMPSAEGDWKFADVHSGRVIRGARHLGTIRQPNPEADALLGKSQKAFAEEYMKEVGVTEERLVESYIGRAEVMGIAIRNMRELLTKNPCRFKRRTNRYDAHVEWKEFLPHPKHDWGVRHKLIAIPDPNLKIFNVAWGNVMNHILNVTDHDDRLMSYLNIAKWNDKELAQYIETGFPSPYTYKGRP